MEARDLVLKLLGSIGKQREADYYLSVFRSRREGFAIICIGSGVNEDIAMAVAADLRLLVHLDLLPVVVCGADTPSTSRPLRDLICRHLATGYQHSDTSTQAVRAAISATKVPVIALPSQHSTTEAIDDITRIATALGSHKLVFVGQYSGVFSGHEMLPMIDLTSEYAPLAAGGTVAPGQLELLGIAKTIIDSVPQRVTIAITSPFDLLRELFTVRGAGTLVRRGSVVRRYSGFAEVDTHRLQLLIEAAFERPLHRPDFTYATEAIYIAGDYRGAAIVVPTPHGAYLSKFAVDRGARGEGIGRDIWRALSSDHPELYWRSRSTNPITPWYDQHCDGLVRGPQWNVYWRGIDEARVSNLLHYARTRGDDFSSGR